MDNKNDGNSPGRFRSKEEWEEYKNKLIADAQAIKEKPKTADKKNSAPIITPTEKKCRHCSMMIPKDAKVCPHCRKKQGTSFAGKFLGIVLILFVIGIAVNAFKENKTATIEKAQKKKKMLPKKQPPGYMVSPRMK